MAMIESGCTYDVGFDINYNYERDYDPATGRYIESDPVGPYSDINTYNYAANNPLTWIDPYGLYKLKGPQVPDPGTVSPLLYGFLNCVEKCYGQPLTVTSTTNDHTKGAHIRGRAVDFTIPEGVVGSGTAVCCALNCGAVYVQNEYLFPSPDAKGLGHIHAQMDAGGGAHGTGRNPKPKCSKCDKTSPLDYR
jgi:RHS repeat-associated protein